MAKKGITLRNCLKFIYLYLWPIFTHALLQILQRELCYLRQFAPRLVENMLIKS